MEDRLWLIYTRNRFEPSGWHLAGFPVAWERAYPIATRECEARGEMVKMIHIGTGKMIFLMPGGGQVAA